MDEEQKKTAIPNPHGHHHRRSSDDKAKNGKPKTSGVSDLEDEKEQDEPKYPTKRSTQEENELGLQNEVDKRKIKGRKKLLDPFYKKKVHKQKKPVRRKGRAHSVLPMSPEEIRAKIEEQNKKKRGEENGGEKAVEKKEEEERADYASNPNEFTKSGTPMPFWMMEMKKGTEYIVKMHRRYGKTVKHELRPAFKPNLEDIDLDVRDSTNAIQLGLVEDEDVLNIGVAHLIAVDRLFLIHKVELNHGVCRTHRLNDYRVVNFHGHLIYRVGVEEGSCCQLIYIFRDFDGRETIRLVPTCFCCRKSRRKYAIFCPAKILAGFVIQKAVQCVCQDPRFFVHDENNVRILEFYRPKTKFKVSSISPGATADYVFEYKSLRGQGPLGRISIKSAELKRANFTDFDYYGIQMPEEMSANIKVRVMAAWFVIYLFCYRGKTHVDIHHSLTQGAKKLFADKKPSVEELPDPDEDRPS